MESKSGRAEGPATVENKKGTTADTVTGLRQTLQPLLPARHPGTEAGRYDLYPVFPLGSGKIFRGTDPLLEYIIAQKTVLIDGYAGVRWTALRNRLEAGLRQRGLSAAITDTRDWFWEPDRIDALAAPYLGERSSVWGRKTDKNLRDFFDPRKISGIRRNETADVHIILGCGAALAGWEAPVIYIDLPKNELQFRMRAGGVTNLGKQGPEEPDQMYKRFYFLDWVVLNQHKKEILDRITVVADGQRPADLFWMYAADLQEALRTMSESVFRVRPWFEPGAWGGQWIKEKIPGVNKAAVNYAWSFELITPENGLLLESDGFMLEVSFDFLMYARGKQVLGEKHAARFGDAFPIRFDFLDTVRGGNLSIQCHPGKTYIREMFGEAFTQDETYYILDAWKQAGVYLGFREDIAPDEFRGELERSNRDNTPVEIERYVQWHPAKKHDLFLIPNKTVHSAAAGNLVLEISATPYIFTFKMYDWLRLDLNGAPRPINIGHAFNNLDFSRKGDKVERELISRPVLLASGADWKLFHLPTHSEHFYDVHRYEFLTSVNIDTAGSCHVLMLVEGSSVTVETAGGRRQRFSYAETFVVPAAAGSYTVINEGEEPVMIVKAFLK